MRPAHFSAVAILTLGAQAFMPSFSSRSRAIPPPIPGDTPFDETSSLAQHRNQRPTMDSSAAKGPGPVLPPGFTSNDPADTPSGGPDRGGIMLSDIMGRDRSINIFAGLARDVESVAKRLDDATQNSTVLAPVNSAFDRLPRKPWEDPEDYKAMGANAYEGDDGQERARNNLRRLVEAHIVMQSPWKEGEKVETMDSGDREVWWECKEGKKVIQPGNIEVTSEGKSVGNGEVWILKDVRNYSS